MLCLRARRLAITLINLALVLVLLSDSLCAQDSVERDPETGAIRITHTKRAPNRNRRTYDAIATFPRRSSPYGEQLSGTASKFREEAKGIVANSDDSEPKSQSKRYIVELQSPAVSQELAIAKQDILSGKRLFTTLSQLAPGERAYLVDKVKHAANIIATEQTQVRRIISGADPALSSPEDSLSLSVNAIVYGSLSSRAIQDLIAKGYRVTEEQELHMLLSDSVPLIGANEVWNHFDSSGFSLTGKGIQIGVIDSGIDYTHPDFGSCTQDQFLNGNCEKVRAGFDFYSRDSDPMDEFLHGTHVASIIAGNGKIRGVAPHAQLYAYRACGTVSCSNIAVLQAIERSMDPNQDGDISDHLDVINLSLGGAGSPDDLLSRAIDNAVAAGVVAVVAAGNAGPWSNSIGSPGNSRAAITVGATFARDENEAAFGAETPHADELASFSSRGPVLWKEDGKLKFLSKPDVVAPGVYICAARASVAPSRPDQECFDSYHMKLSGTSMATPHVAGVVALIKQAHPQWTPEQIKALLKSTSKNLFDPHSGDLYPSSGVGTGRIQALEAALASSAPLTVPDASIYTQDKVQGLDIPILGTAAGDGLQSYTLEVRRSNSSSSGWTEIYRGTSQVVNGILGLWKTAGFQDGNYLVRLTVTTSNRIYQDIGSLELRNVEIISPASKYFTPDFGFGTSIDIEGTVVGEGLQHYIVEWCKGGTSEINCSSEGIELVGDGNQAIERSLLARFYPNKVANLASGDLTIKLTAFFSGGDPTIRTVPITLSSDIAVGFPMRLKQEFTFGDEYLNIAHFSDGGGSGIIFTDNDGMHLVDSIGKEFPGWPISYDRGGVFHPLIADADGDGKVDVIGLDSEIGRYRAWDRGGKELDGWPRDLLGRINRDLYYTSYDGVVDIDGDGARELAVYSPWYEQFEIVTFDGKSIFSARVPGNLTNYQTEPPFALARLSSSTVHEVVVLSQLYSGDSGIVDKSLIETVISAFGKDGKQLPGWPKLIKGNQDVQVPTIADIDQDGRDEVIVRLQDAANVIVHAFNGNGDELPGWPVVLKGRDGAIGGGWYYVQPEVASAADLDSDGRPEIITTTTSKPGGNTESCVNVLRFDGQQLSGWPRCAALGTSLGASVAIANLDDDAESELLVTAYNWRNQLFGWKLNGSTVSGFPKYLGDEPAARSCLVADINRDNQTEIVCRLASEISVYNIASCTDGAEEWPFYLHDAEFSNVYKAPDAPKCSLPLELPRIVANPRNVVGKVSEYAWFEVEARGRGALQFRWEQNRFGSSNWEFLAGSSEPKMSRMLTSDMNGSKIRVVVSSEFGSVISTSALVTILDSSLPVPTVARPAVTPTAVPTSCKSGVSCSNSSELRDLITSLAKKVRSLRYWKSRTVQRKLTLNLKRRLIAIDSWLRVNSRLSVSVLHTRSSLQSASRDLLGATSKSFAARKRKFLFRLDELSKLLLS